MSREEAVDPNILDALAPDDDQDQPHYSSAPHAIPDHGRRPRRPKRPTLVVYRNDAHNLYRPANDPAVVHGIDDDLGREPAWISARRQVASLLAKTARDHAPRLSWRSDSSIAEFIELEALPDARLVAKLSLLPSDIASRVLDKFLEVLWEEIALIRENRRNTRT